MRTDQTAAYIAAMADTTAQPVFLAEFYFATGTVYLASKDITVGTQAYSGLISSWDKEQRIDSKGLFDIPIQSRALTINNVGSPFSAHLIANSPQNTLVKTYLWFDNVGLGSADKAGAEIGRYYIEKPDWDGFTCNILLINELYRANKPIGTKIDLTTYPGAAPKAVGEPANIIYGSVKDVSAKCIVAGGADILAVAMTKTSTTITISKLPNAKRFPTSGAFTVRIKNEQIRCSGYNDTTKVLSVTTRGYNSTIASEHGVGQAVWEYLASYDYLGADHDVKAIGDVRVNGSKVLTGVTKILTPKAKVQLSPDLTLETGVNLETLDSGLLFGNTNRDITLYAEAAVCLANSSQTCILAANTPNLGPVKKVTANLTIYNYGAASADLNISGGTGMTCTYSNLTINPGLNTYTLPATAVTAAMVWQTALRAIVYSTTKKIAILDCHFDVTYDGTGVIPVNTAIIAGNIGTGLIGSSGLTVPVATDTERLGNIVGISCMCNISNPGVALTFDASGSTNLGINILGGSGLGGIDFTAATTWDLACGASTILSTASWITDIKANLTGNTMVCNSLYFRVLYQDANYFKPGGVSLDGLNAAAIEIGNRVTFDCDGQPDDGSGTYTGTPSALITNPADVKRHFITVYGGLTVDATRFNAARAAYAAKSYVFGGVINDYPLFLDVLSKMMFQGRSMIWDSLGAVRILMLPDTAPASSNNLTKADILKDWESHVPMVRMQPVSKDRILNKIGLHYNKVGDGWNIRYYGFVPESSDATSITNYGVCEQPEYYKCDFINDSATAISLQAFVLGKYKGRSAPAVPFNTILANFDIEPGDFITVTDADAAIGLDNRTAFIVTEATLEPSVLMQNGMKSLEHISLTIDGYGSYMAIADESAADDSVAG